MSLISGRTDPWNRSLHVNEIDGELDSVTDFDSIESTSFAIHGKDLFGLDTFTAPFNKECLLEFSFLESASNVPPSKNDLHATATRDKNVADEQDRDSRRLEADDDDKSKMQSSQLASSVHEWWTSGHRGNLDSYPSHQWNTEDAR